MPWGAAIAAVGSIAGAAIGGSKGSGGGGSSAQSSSNVPWSVQQPYLERGMDQASGILTSRSGAAIPATYLAGTNGMQTTATQGLYDQGLASQNAANSVMNSVSPLLNTGQTYANTATGIANNGIGAQNGTMTGLLSNYAATGSMPGSMGANPALTAGLSGAALGSLGSLGQSQSIANRVANASPGAAMESTVQGANRYINNDVLQGQIDAIGTDISRNLGENTLYGIRQGAQTSGNTNSSREGALEAIGTRGAQENLANAAATIRGNAYQTGAGLAAGQYQNAQTNALGAAGALNTTGATAGTIGNTQASLQQQQGQYDTTSRLGAANSALGNDLSWSQANTAARLGANAQLGTGLTIGANNTLAGSQGALAGLTAAQGAGTYQQQQDQQGINAANAIFAANDQRQQSVLNDYWNIVGKPLGSMGSQDTTTSQNGPGMIGGAIGGAAGAYGIYNNLFGANGSMGSGSYTNADLDAIDNGRWSLQDRLAAASYNDARGY